MPRRQLLCPACPGGSPPWAWPDAHLRSVGASTRGPPGWPRVGRRRQGLWGSPALRTRPRLPAGGEPRRLCVAPLAWDAPHQRSCLSREVERESLAPASREKLASQETPQGPRGRLPCSRWGAWALRSWGPRTGQDGTGCSSVSRCRGAAPGPVDEAEVWVGRGAGQQLAVRDGSSRSRESHSLTPVRQEREGRT
ncbi:hypothetical protein HJG60_010716 [Phyllostomus discolor]|uniref:Uncharacterized protein n=1 Tax=Phyllostomus discolor TaxID=89673 RepID=A0A834EBJ2_9CHIR|nr:hypothetical protein HJG60_010716 [Phyllostomus discolor]